jgi:hypothetical protein
MEEEEENNSLSTFRGYTSQCAVILILVKPLKLKPNSNSSVGHPAGTRADAKSRRRPVPREARVRAVPGDRDGVLARAGRVAASGPASGVRRRRRARLGARRPRRDHVSRDRRRAPGVRVAGRAPERCVRSLDRLLGHRRRRPGQGGGVARRVLQMRLRGHPALEPLEAEAGPVVVVPLLARGRVRERALPPRGGVVAARALGPGVLQRAAAAVPAPCRRAPSSSAGGGVVVAPAEQPSPAPAPLPHQHRLAVVGARVSVAPQRQLEGSVSWRGAGGRGGRRRRLRRRGEEEREAGLGADQRLHAAHGGEVDLATHLVPPHQGLQPHQPAQRAEGSPGLQPSGEIIRKRVSDTNHSIVELPSTFSLLTRLPKHGNGTGRTRMLRPLH